METYRHRVLGLYDTRAGAEATRAALVRCGMPAANLSLMQPDHRFVAWAGPSDGGDAALLVNGAGAPGDEAIERAIAGVSLFAASPVLGALMAQGWRASLGRLVGVLDGSTNGATGVDDAPLDEGRLAGAAVLVAQADDERQAVLSRLIVAASMAGANLSTWRDDRAEARVGTPWPQELAGADPVLRSLLNRRRQPERRVAVALAGHAGNGHPT